MRVALVMGNYKKQGYPPLGVLYLASYLRTYRPECHVEVFDVLPENRVLLEGQFDLIGFSCLSIQYPDICEYAQRLRKEYDGYLLIGGVHITLTHQIPKWADFGIVGEGECTLYELVSALMGLHSLPVEQIPGLLVRQKDGVIETGQRQLIQDLDTIPYPAWDLIDMTDYLKPNNVYGTVIGRGLSMMTSRGCCYSCRFCAASKMWKTIRFHSAEYVAGMIAYMIEQYQIDYIWVADDHFALKKGRLSKLAELLEKQKVHVKLGISARVESYDDEMALLLHRLGVEAIALGLETGSDRVLKAIKSGSTLTIAQEQKIVEKMNEDGFQVHGMFMINTPDETLDDLRMTVEWIHRLPLCKVSVAVALPYYGTEWWDIAVEQGVVTDNPNDYRQLRAYNMKKLQSERPIFKTEIPREILDETYDALSRYGRSLFYFDWEHR